METVVTVTLLVLHLAMMVMWFMVGKFDERMRIGRRYRVFLTELMPRVDQLFAQIKGKTKDEAIDLSVDFDLKNIDKMTDIIYGQREKK